MVSEIKGNSHLMSCITDAECIHTALECDGGRQASAVWGSNPAEASLAHQLGT
ncbi:MAG: hypothetical protein JRJ87_21105 [Deltaproteobacteria bacterium]|nr:hypothetical protein [Deltaproteobacteria bacterium]